MIVGEATADAGGEEMTPDVMSIDPTIATPVAQLLIFIPQSLRFIGASPTAQDPEAKGIGARRATRQ